MVDKDKLTDEDRRLIALAYRMEGERAVAKITGLPGPVVRGIMSGQARKAGKCKRLAGVPVEEAKQRPARKSKTSAVLPNMAANDNPIIAGMLNRLPPLGQPWPGCRNWTRAFSELIIYLYEEDKLLEL